MEFDKKVSSLLSSSKEENSFVKEALKASNETLSGNGSLKYTTSGDDFVDNFFAISTFKSSDISPLFLLDITNTSLSLKLVSC